MHLCDHSSGSFLDFAILKKKPTIRAALINMIKLDAKNVMMNQKGLFKW